MTRKLSTMAALAGMTLATAAFAGTSGHHPFMGGNLGLATAPRAVQADYALTGSHDARQRDAASYDANRKDHLMSDQRSDWNANSDATANRSEHVRSQDVTTNRSDNVRIHDAQLQADRDLNRGTYRSSLDANTDNAKTYGQPVQAQPAQAQPAQAQPAQQTYTEPVTSPRELKPEWVWKSGHGRTLIMVPADK